MRAQDEDFTWQLGQLGSKGFDGEPFEWEMYSFNRVSYIFWNAFANELKRQGRTNEEVKDYLQSRSTRYLLDYREGEIEALAIEMAKFVTKENNDGP